MTDDDRREDSERAPRRFTWGDAVLMLVPFVIVLYAGGKFAALSAGEQDRVEPVFQLSLLAGVAIAGVALWRGVARSRRRRAQAPSGAAIAGGVLCAVFLMAALRGPAHPVTFVVLGASAGFMFATMGGLGGRAGRDRRRARAVDSR